MRAQAAAVERTRPADADARPAQPPPLELRARGIGKTYGSRVALTGVDLVLPAGTTTAIVGDNGAGKSSLLACLAGVASHTGSVTLRGRPIRSLPGGRVAYLPQRVRPPAAATVAELLAAFRAIARSPTDRAEPPDGFLPAGGRMLAQLSGGELRRVMLVGALLGVPDLVLLDEPLANLDDEARHVAFELIGAHRAAGAIVVMASPSAVEVLVAADRVVRIEGGRVTTVEDARIALGRLRVSIWIALVDGRPTVDELRPAGIHDIRREGDWLVARCPESGVMELVRWLARLGLGEERVRFAAPADDGSRRREPFGDEP